MEQNSKIIVLDGLQFQSLINKIDTIHQILISTSRNKEPEELLSTKDAARKLKVCSKTVISMIENGKLIATKLNKGEGKRGHFKISKPDLEKFIKSHRLGY